MKMFRNLRIFLVVLVLFLIFDGLVIGLFTSSFYSRELSNIARMNNGMLEPKWFGVGVVYLILAFGVSYYVILKDEKTTEATIFLKGMLFGLVVYGIYNIANYSLLKDWTTNLIIVDVSWGAALCGAVALGAYMINQLLE